MPIGRKIFLFKLDVEYTMLGNARIKETFILKLTQGKTFLNFI